MRGFLQTVTGSGRAVVELARSGVVRPVRPDKLARMGGGLLRYGATAAAGVVAGAARHPDRTAIVDDAGWISYGELDRRTDRLARALADSGVTAGTRVGVLCRNHRAAIEAPVAAGKLGADVVLINTGMSTGQIGDLARELDVHTVVADTDFDLPDGVRSVAAWGAAPGTGLEAMIAAAGRADLPWRPPASHTIVLTSGTTGPPKGARRPAPSSLTPVAAVLSAIPLRAGEPVFIAAPLLHTWGNAALLLALLHGAPIVLRRKFDAAAFRATMADCDATFAVPVMLQRALQEPGEARPRIVAVSGSALPVAVADAFLDRFGPCLYNLYGSTEVSWVSIATPDDLRAAPGTAGRAPAGTRLRIVDDEGHDVAPGTDGRVFVGNDMPFEGYTREGSSVETLDGLLGTGDVGHLDPEGRLFLTGRGDDMIVSGGENVHPGPVEELLAGRAEVREAAVVGVDDEDYGQRLAAYVVPSEGSSPSEDGVRGWVKAELSRFAVPRDVHFVSELPRNATGKVDKSALG